MVSSLHSVLSAVYVTLTLSGCPFIPVCPHFQQVGREDAIRPE